MNVNNTHGICLIINNVIFQSYRLNNRTGSEVDAENLRTVFTKLNYRVEVKDNLSVDKMAAVAAEYSKMNHSDFDSFVCCILTHGSDDDILYGTDGKEINLNKILQMFHSSKCQSLAGKPKIFIIQACRGDKEDIGGISIQLNARIETDSEPTHSEYELRSTVKINFPEMSDFLIAYTTATGYVSWRSKTEGTWYISELCDLLTTGHKKYDLMTILTQVNNRVASKTTEQGLKQMPAPVSYLRGSIHIP